MSFKTITDEVKRKQGFLKLDFNFSEICETVIPPLYATLQCVYDTKPINCASNLVAGTLIYSKCDPMFHYEKEVNYSRMTCQENGKYDVVLGDCIPSKSHM